MSTRYQTSAKEKHKSRDGGEFERRTNNSVSMFLLFRESKNRNEKKGAVNFLSSLFFLASHSSPLSLSSFFNLLSFFFFLPSRRPSRRPSRPQGGLRATRRRRRLGRLWRGKGEDEKGKKESEKREREKNPEKKTRKKM